MEGLHEQGVSEAEIVAVQGAISENDFGEPVFSLLKLAEQVTVDPANASDYVNPALVAGNSEAEVAHAIFVVSYFNMVTRIAEAFDLPPDASHPFDPEWELPLVECRP